MHDPAIDEARARLGERSTRVASLKALHRLFVDARDTDAAWCAARALVFLEAADADERGRYERGVRTKLPATTRRLTDPHWLELLRHPDEDLLVSQLLQQVWPAVLGLRGKTDRDAGLRPRDLVDPEKSVVALARAFGFASGVLGIHPPRLYVRSDVAGGLAHLPVFPLASLAGAMLLTGFDARELLFVVARHLGDYRGEHYIRTLMPYPLEVKRVLLAALRIGGVGDAGDAQIDAAAREMDGKLAPAQRQALATLGRRLLAAGHDVDTTRWLHGVELGVCRAAFLLADDLAISAKMIRAVGAAGPDDLPAEAKIDDLVAFGVSAEYARLRATLGIRARFT